MTKRRRIILNDDGAVTPPRGDPITFRGHRLATIEDYVGVRSKAAVGTQVDTYLVTVANIRQDLARGHIVGVAAGAALLAARTAGHDKELTEFLEEPGWSE